MATLTQLESLKQALSLDRPPLCSGVVSPSPEGLCIYYGKENPRFVNFASATSRDLDLLTAACDPATLGRGNKGVCDESYRKAVEMDASNFSVQLDLASSGLMRTIEDQLLQSETEKMYIRAELRKLNVYGKDSVLKAHKDTPRGTDMLGSLVVVYPTPHEGGELVLRHKGHEWKFDANDLASSRSSPSLAYIAFYSDIEHEVLKVTSGHRVTVTYSLHLVDPALRPGALTVAPNLKAISNLQTTLRGLLESPEFLPYGGMLGFGITHLYPITFETELQEMANCLKGEDAHIYRTCQELQLQPSLQMIYEDGSEEYGIMLDRIVEDPGYDFRFGERYQDALMGLGGVSVKVYGDVEGELEGELITWISPFNERNLLQDISMGDFGKWCSAKHIDCSPCMIVRVAAADDRL